MLIPAQGSSLRLQGRSCDFCCQLMFILVGGDAACVCLDRNSEDELTLSIR